MTTCRTVVFLVLYLGSMQAEGTTANAAANILSTGCVLAKTLSGSDEYLQLTWRLHLQNISKEDVRVTLNWTQNNMPRSCTNITSNSCTWTIKAKDRPLFDGIINVSLTVESSLPNVTLDTKPFVYNQDPLECAKNPPVNQMVISKRLGTCLDVSWKYRDEMYMCMYCNLQFRLQYMQPGQESWKNGSDILDSSVTSYKLCNLTPFTEYIISVQSRPTVIITRIITGIWSDRKTVKGMTLETTPTGSVEIANGFAMSRDNCDKAAANRNVMIYWKPVNKASRNGIITTYFIKVTKLQTTSGRNVGQSLQFLVNSSAVCLSQTLQCSNSYNIIVTAATRAGNSSSSSSIVIPESIRVLKMLVEVIVLVLPSSHNASVEVLWRLDKMLAESSTALVLWCRKNKQNHCKEDVNWKSVPANTTSLHVSLPGISSDFMFGVSIRTEGRSSPIQWTSCMYKKSKELPAAPLNVRFDSVSKANSLRILWDGQQCSSTQSGVYISSYNITLCEASITSNICTGNKWYTVNSSLTSLEIKDLEPQKRYGVSVVAINLDGKGGQPSRFVFKSIEDRQLDVLSSISIGWKIGLSVIILFLFILMVLGMRCCAKNLHQRCSKKVPIDVPEMEGEDVNMLPKPKDTPNDNIPAKVAEKQALQDEVSAQESESQCTLSDASPGLELRSPVSQTKICLQEGQSLIENQIRQEDNNIAKSPPGSHFENHGSADPSLCLRHFSVSEARSASLSTNGSVTDSYVVVGQSGSLCTGRVTPSTEVENMSEVTECMSSATKTCSRAHSDCPSLKANEPDIKTKLESAGSNLASKKVVNELSCRNNVLKSTDCELRQVSDYCLSEKVQKDGLSNGNKDTFNEPFLRSCAISSEKGSNSFKPNESISNLEYVPSSTMEQPNLPTPASNTEQSQEEIRPEISITGNISENGILCSYQLFTQADLAGISQNSFLSPDIAIHKQDTKEKMPNVREPEQVWIGMQSNR